LLLQGGAGDSFCGILIPAHLTPVMPLMRVEFILGDGEKPGFHLGSELVWASRPPGFGQCFLRDILAQIRATEPYREWPEMWHETEELTFELSIRVGQGWCSRRGCNRQIHDWFLLLRRSPMRLLEAAVLRLAPASQASGFTRYQHSWNQSGKLVNAIQRATTVMIKWIKS
jgi:hypothetical protein